MLNAHATIMMLHRGKALFVTLTWSESPATKVITLMGGKKQHTSLFKITTL